MGSSTRPTWRGSRTTPAAGSATSCAPCACSRAKHGAKDEGLARELLKYGDRGAALARLSWILGIAGEPARRSEIERAGVAWHIADAYGTWVETARFLP